jgi:DNA-directed RNA polymerase specialized sigma24 family protein
MMTASYCDCLICRLEASLIAELGDDRSREEFRLFVLPSPVLSPFPSAFELVQALQDHSNREQNPSSDELLSALLERADGAPLGLVWQRVLLLVFIPTIHRTTTQVTTTFPSLTRDDAAQHLFAVLLEFFQSRELRSRRSHLGFAVARKIRRSAFRWAIREAHRSLRDETDGTATAHLAADASHEDSHADILLQQFLGDCQRRGWLSSEERGLLTQFKLEGISCSELARRNHHSAVAIRHRIQRLVGRLRRIAQTSGNGASEQLDLFSSISPAASGGRLSAGRQRTSGKIFK